MLHTILQMIDLPLKLVGDQTPQFQGLKDYAKCDLEK